MARKRTAAAEQSTTATAEPNTSPDVFDQAIADQHATTSEQAANAAKAAEIVQSIAEHTDANAHLNGHAARHAPREQHQSHAEAVGKKEPRYNHQGITDKIAGASLLEHHHPYLTVIRFEEKPSESVRTKLREAGFEWQRQNEEWTRPIRYDSRAQDRYTADLLFNDITKLIRTEKGVTHDYGSPAAAR